MTEFITQGEYQKKTETMIMRDEKPPRLGYRPFDIRQRVEKLLEIEERAKKICKDASFKKISITCPCPNCDGCIGFEQFI